MTATTVNPIHKLTFGSFDDSADEMATATAISDPNLTFGYVLRTVPDPNLTFGYVLPSEAAEAVEETQAVEESAPRGHGGGHGRAVPVKGDNRRTSTSSST